MGKMEKKINDELQHIEEIIDNVKSDLEYIFDENVDAETKFDAYKSSFYLLNNDLEEARKNLNYWINEYSKGKGE